MPITAASASYIFRYICSLTNTSFGSTSRNLLQEENVKHATAAYKPYIVVRFIFLVFMFTLLTIILKPSLNSHLYCPKLRCHADIDTLAIDRAIRTKFRVVS